MSPRNIPTRNVELSPGFETHSVGITADTAIHAVPVPFAAPPVRIHTITRPTAPPIRSIVFKKDAVPSRKFAFSKRVIPKIRAVKISERKSVVAHRIPLKAARKIETSYSQMLDNKPIILDMIDLKYVPYPVISEIIRMFAEKNNVSYSQVKLVGIFVPIPSELVKSTHIDSFAGKLHLFLRRNTKKVKPRCVRIAFGRLRTNDKIVQCVLPLN